MKNLTKRSLSLLLALVICVGLLSGLTFTVSAADVDYVYSGNYIYNWGTREETATFLSPNAVSFYEDNDVTYEELAALSGASTLSAVPNSALYKKLQALMEEAHKWETNYADTRALYQYTDCQANGTWNSKKISSFYSGTGIGPAWDSGKTWNREHTWPDSKGLGGNDEHDIMMLRPTSVNENSSRSNTAYGESGSFYNPNSESRGKHNLHGDVARIALYVYVRWGNTLSMWGSSGVIESKEVLLKWMAEDPVDTWELGRNDSVESMTGTRNVFVDYPELAFVLFDAVIPADMQTPSGEAGNYDFNVSAVSNNPDYGTVSIDGLTITATPAEGYVVDGYTVLNGTANVTQNGKTFNVAPKSDCTIQINFVEKSVCMVRFAENGTVTTTMTPYTGETITMPKSTATVDGYTFLGWSAAEVDATAQKPTYYAAGSTCEITGNTIFYALYTYGVAGTGNVFEKVTSVPSNWEGEYVLTGIDPKTGTNYVFLADGTEPNSAAAVKDFATAGLSKEGNVLKGVTDRYVVVAKKVGSNYSLRLKGASSTLYLMTTNSNDGFNKTNSTSSNEARWNFAFSNGKVVIRNAAYTSRTLQYNSGNTLFRTYTSTQQPLVLYKRSGTATEDFYSTLTGVAPCAHTTTTTTTIAATCTKTGSLIVSCISCGTTVSTETIPVADHSYETVVTAPTCTKGGYTTHTCIYCGNVYIDDETEMAPHTDEYIDNGNGTHDAICSVCGEISIDDEEHTYVDGTCICGAKDTTIAPEASVAASGMNLRLQDLLKLGFYFKASSEQEIVNAGALLWTAEQYAQETDYTVTSTIAKHYTDLVGAGGSYSVETDGIYAQYLDTVYYFRPYVQTEYGIVYGNVVSASALTYANIVYNGTGHSAELKSLVIDLLNYATAARTYFGYSEGVPAPEKAFNSILSGADKVVNWSEDMKAGVQVISESDTAFHPTPYGVSTNLLEAIALNMLFEDGQGVEGMLYWDASDYAANEAHDATTATGDLEVTDGGAAVYGSVTGIYAFQMYSNYYFRAYDAAGNLSKTYCVSAASYLTTALSQHANATSEEDVAFVNLVKAMMVYGTNAKTNPEINKG